MGTPAADLAGHKYGRLTVVGRAPNSDNLRDTSTYWNCICECGQQSPDPVRKTALENRKPQSGCGQACDNLTSHLDSIGRDYNGALCTSVDMSLSAKEIGNTVRNHDGNLGSTNYWYHVLYSCCDVQSSKDSSDISKSEEGVPNTCGRGCFYQAAHQKYVNEPFGRLRVLEITTSLETYSDGSSSNRTAFKCICECGNECLPLAKNVTGGFTQSCGCLNVESGKLNAGEKNGWRNRRTFEGTSGP